MLSFTHSQVVPKLFWDFFLLLHIKDYILKNVGNQTVDCSHWLPQYSIIFQTIEVNGCQQVFGSSVYLLSFKLWCITYFTLLASSWYCTSNYATCIYIHAHGRCISLVHSLVIEPYDFGITIFTFIVDTLPQSNFYWIKVHISLVQIYRFKTHDI